MGKLFSSQRLDHLGLVAQLCRQIKLVETVDALPPPPADKKVTYGELLLAMIVNGFDIRSAGKR